MILKISVVFRHQMKLYERTFRGAFTYLFPSLVAGYFDQVALFHLVLGVLLRLSFEEIWAGALGADFFGISGGWICFWIFAKSLHLDQRGQLMYSPGNYLGRKAGKSSTPKGRKCREYVIIPSREKIFTMKDTISCLKLPFWFQSRKCLVKKRNPMVTWWFQSRHNWVYPYGTRTTWYVLCSLGILGEYLYTLYICKP